MSAFLIEDEIGGWIVVGPLQGVLGFLVEEEIIVECQVELHGGVGGRFLEDPRDPIEDRL